LTNFETLQKDALNNYESKNYSGLKVPWRQIKATSGHFLTLTLPLTNFFATDLDETLDKKSLNYVESKNLSDFFTKLHV
jgi:hypothetical protein